MHILTSEQTYLTKHNQQQQVNPAWFTDWQENILSRLGISFADSLARLYRGVMEKK